MSQPDDLNKTIQDLIDRQTEGAYWDFKLQHHANNADLIHDVLCLANAEHQGDRFLVFGVDDATYALQSIANTPNRKSQSDVVSVFRDNSSKFFESRIPNIYLREIEINGDTLDVLVIEDRPFKPYHLVDDYSRQSRKLRAHHIYTRVNDTNTPMPDSAPPHEVIRMWREKFGLDSSAIERALRFLQEPDSWEYVSEDFFGEGYYHHKIFPEFTLKVADTDSTVVACNEEWTRGEIRRDNNSVRFYLLYYHQTLLHRTRVVTFDDGKKSMVAPNWRPRGAGRFYFYLADSVEYALQRFHSASRHKDDSTDLCIRGQGQDSEEARSLWPEGLRIPSLENYELKAFLGEEEECEPSTDDVEQYQLFLRNQLDFEEWRDNQATT
ncbi:MAG: ATP-binding protein [Chloroflexi bacterium]|nr:ATP-binding protein [Chloroflexota bacterium]